MASIIGTQLNTGAAHPYVLSIDGLDVLKEPAVPSRYGVQTDSIQVTEAGSGGVSSMRFVIDDPQILITIANGARIIFWDMVRNLPVFVGNLESLAYRPDFGQQGRVIEVGAFGLESLLDTVIVPSLSSVSGDAGTPIGPNMWDEAMLQVIAGFTGLRTGSLGATNGHDPSALDTPIGATDGSRNTVLNIGVTVVMDGMTVRQAFDAWRAAATTFLMGVGLTTASPSIFVSVDFWGGVRLFAFGGGITSWLPSDYAALTISDTPTGTLAAEDIDWEQDFSPGAIFNAVYVKGGAAASTGWVVRDTTTGRREGYATTAGTDTNSKLSAAGAVMDNRATSAGRGTFSLTSYTPTNVHPGSQVTITDARIGFNSQACLVTAISKTMNSNGTQNWTVSFIDGGGTPTAGRQSAMATLRSLTRGTN